MEHHHVNYGRATQLRQSKGHMHRSTSVQRELELRRLRSGYMRSAPPPAAPPPLPARNPKCSRFFADRLRQPRTESHNQTYHLALASAATRSAPRTRRIWDAIVFGFELPMLRLHMRTLFSSVAGFLVTEADGCFQTRQSKRPVLTDALTNGTLPDFMVNKTHVRIVTRAEALRYFRSGVDTLCRRERKSIAGYSSRCFQVGVYTALPLPP
jgi:hypothetical protein